MSFAAVMENQTSITKLGNAQNSHHHYKTYITEVKDYLVEYGEEVDNEEADEFENAVLFCSTPYSFKIYYARSQIADEEEHGYHSVSFHKVNELPLFIQFENFRL